MRRLDIFRNECELGMSRNIHTVIRLIAAIGARWLYAIIYQLTAVHASRIPRLVSFIAFKSQLSPSHCATRISDAIGHSTHIKPPGLFSHGDGSGKSSWMYLPTLPSRKLSSHVLSHSVSVNRRSRPTILQSPWSSPPMSFMLP